MKMKFYLDGSFSWIYIEEGISLSLLLYLSLSLFFYFLFFLLTEQRKENRKAPQEEVEVPCRPGLECNGLKFIVTVSNPPYVK